jgi:hypothetical protein
MEDSKMCFQKELNRDSLAGPFRIILLIMALVAAVSLPVPVFADSSISNYSAVPPFISQGVTPNVLVILDNSNSMDEDVNGNAVGSDAPNSRSEIARQAILTLVEKNASRMKFGLMAYKQYMQGVSAVSRNEIHNAFYYCSYDPDSYNATATPTPKDPSSNTQRYPNPTDPGNYIYYDQALPYYSGNNDGVGFCYYDHFDNCDDPDYPDPYYCFSQRHWNGSEPSGSQTTDSLLNTYEYVGLIPWGSDDHWCFGPTDSDIAAGFDHFGEQLSWSHVGPAWFSNNSPGKGWLHVPTEASTEAHITAFEEKLATSQFDIDTDTPLRNAGLTPLAGTIASAGRYFQHVLPADEGGVEFSPIQHWCQKNFIVLVTDGLPSVDQNGNPGSADTLLPELQNEVQLLRSTSVTDFDDPFDIQTFVIGFALPPGLGSKLDDIAVAGGTDVDGHAYLADNADELAEVLQNIFLEILNRVASGSAASVISNSRSGEGAIYQSIFFPEKRDSSGNIVNWVGDTHALFIDAYGNMREDNNTNDTLDMDIDKIVIFDEETAKAKLYDPIDFDPLNPDPNFDSEVDLSKLGYIWSASGPYSWLSSTSMDVLTQRTYASADHKRYIFTDKIDTSQSVSMNNVDSTDVMDFIPGFVNDAANDNYYFLNPYLTYSTPEVGLTEDEMITEAQNIIRFVRGEEGLSETGTGTPYPNRTLDINGTDEVWRLGDIIQSTPTVVSQPSEDYDLLYKDDSYREFRKKYLNRRIVVYAGANDGMLHAFNGGFYDASAHKFYTQPPFNDLGSELWAYVPNALLPHLKWLKESSGYSTHVYYVDLKPRIFDARIFSVDADHPKGWGTVLIGGMRFGGKPIGVDTTTDGNGDPAPDGTDDLSFRSCFFALDITNPEVAPSLLWSFSDDNLGFTTSYPTPIRVGSKWFIVIGSGPDNYEATRDTAYGGSNRTASVYILNADDGTLAREFSMDGHSFMAAPIAVDFDLVTDPVSPGPNDSVLWTGEAIYIASDGCGT